MKAIALSLASLLLLPIFVIAAMGEAFGEGFQQAAAAPASESYGNSPDSQQVPQGDIEKQVLSNPRIRLSAGARRDVEVGRADRRVLQVLLILAEQHHLGYVGPIASGHSYFVKGTTRVSNHVHGRAVDISVIDGKAVTASNEGAYRAAETVASLPPPLRPSELGAPWKMNGEGLYGFTKDHGDHLHIGYKA